MDFEIIPTAGWTRIMANERRQKLQAISENPKRRDDWQAFERANFLSDSVYAATGKVNDPYFIHTHTYDSIQDISLQRQTISIQIFTFSLILAYIVKYST